MRLTALATSIALVASTLPALSAEWVTKKSPHSVAKTVEQLTAAVEKAGAKVFAVVDHAAGASTIGAELAPATLVIFGNPKIGTPIMQGNIRAGIDLPIRVLVFEEGREVMIGYKSPAALKAAYKVEGADKSFKVMTGALDKLTNAAIK